MFLGNEIVQFEPLNSDLLFNMEDIFLQNQPVSGTSDDVNNEFLLTPPQPHANTINPATNNNVSYINILASLFL